MVISFRCYQFDNLPLLALSGDSVRVCRKLGGLQADMALMDWASHALQPKLQKVLVVMRNLWKNFDV